MNSATPMASPYVLHVYVSTWCQHELHGNCRLSCKHCQAACRCPCHELDNEGTEG